MKLKPLFLLVKTIVSAHSDYLDNPSFHESQQFFCIDNRLGGSVHKKKGGELPVKSLPLIFSQRQVEFSCQRKNLDKHRLPHEFSVRPVALHGPI